MEEELKLKVSVRCREKKESSNRQCTVYCKLILTSKLTFNMNGIIIHLPHSCIPIDFGG